MKSNVIWVYRSFVLNELDRFWSWSLLSSLCLGLFFPLFFLFFLAMGITEKERTIIY